MEFKIDFKVNRKFKFNGKEYNSLDEMPEDVRAVFEKVLKGDTSARIYKSLDEIPDDIKAKVRKALDTNEPDSSAGTAILASTAVAFENRAARFLNIVSIPVLFWALFFYSSFNWMLMFLCCLLPLCAIIVFIRSKGSIWFNPINKEMSQHSGFAAMLPTFAIVIRTVSDSHILGFNHVVNPLLTAFFLLAFLICFNEARYRMNNRNTLMILVFLILPYCYGLTVQTNRLFDTSMPMQYTVKVVDKFHVHDTESISDVIGAYYGGHSLLITPWGELKGETDVKVGKKFYDGVNKGDNLSISLRKGFLKIPWYTLQSAKLGD